MFFFKWVITCLQTGFREVSRAIFFAGYNDSTICNFFRKRGARIGEDCHIFIKSLGRPYLVSLGNHVWISKGVLFHDHDGGAWVVRDNKNPFLAVYGPIIIEDNCIIGPSAHLLPNIRIGRNSIVGPGSVVISDVPPNSIVMGVPARPISSLLKYKEKCLALWEVQKPPDLEANKTGWSQSKEARKKMRRHLTALFMNQAKEEKGNADK